MWPRCCPSTATSGPTWGSATPRRWRRIVVDDDTDEPMPEDDAEFAARDEQTLADYAANPYGFTAGMKFKGE